MTCEFVIKKDGELKCMCNNLARGLINGKRTNISSSKCLENPNCYYKLYKRALKEIEKYESKNV